jgi:hypothetical protein
MRFLFIALLFSSWLPVQGQNGRGISTNQDLQVLLNPASPFFEFNNAVNELAKQGQSADLWLSIASDTRYSPSARRRCVRQFFDEYVSLGMSVSNLVKVIGSNTNWMSIDDISGPMHFVSGWAPDVELPGVSKFYVPVLSKDKGDYQLVICLSFNEEIPIAAFRLALEGKAAGTSTSASKTVGCKLYDSFDQDKRFGKGLDAVYWPWLHANLHRTDGSQ